MLPHAEFWGSRWNVPQSRLLKALVYDVVREGRLVRQPPSAFAKHQPGAGWARPKAASVQSTRCHCKAPCLRLWSFLLVSRVVAEGNSYAKVQHTICMPTLHTLALCFCLAGFFLFSPWACLGWLGLFGSCTFSPGCSAHSLTVRLPWNSKDFGALGLAHSWPPTAIMPLNRRHLQLH